MRRKHIFVLVFIWGAIYLTGAGYPPALLDDADTVHAEAAREMVESGDWVTLHVNKVRYLEKAPLMYWLVATSYEALGVSEFSTRLPVALGALALILTTFQIGSRAFGERAGFYSGLVIATSIGLYLFTRVLWPDGLLTLFISLCFYCFVRADEDQGGQKYYYGMYFFSALAVLTKGLVGLVFPAVIIAIYLLITGRLGRLRQFKLLTGAVLFLAIAAPWHLLAGFRNEGFLWFYFVNEHFLRYVGERYPVDYDKVPLGLFLGLHLAWLFPWSPFLPLAVRNVPRRLGDLNREERILLFVLVWAVVVIVFFCFSTTQEYYTMPAYPALALVIGKGLARAEPNPDERKGGRLLTSTQVALAVLGLILFGAGTAAYVLTRGIAVQGDISTTLTRNPHAYALALGHILDLTPRSVSALEVPIMGAAIVFLLGTGLALLLRLKGNHGGANLCAGLMMVAFFFFAHTALIKFEPYLSSKALAERINREYKEGDVIIINGEYEGGSSVNFYTRKTVHILNGRSANLEYGSYFKDAPNIFINDEDLGSIWASPGRVYLVIDSSWLDHFDHLLHGNVYRLVERGGKSVLTNQP